MTEKKMRDFPSCKHTLSQVIRVFSYKNWIRDRGDLHFIYIQDFH